MARTVCGAGARTCCLNSGDHPASFRGVPIAPKVLLVNRFSLSDITHGEAWPSGRESQREKWPEPDGGGTP